MSQPITLDVNPPHGAADQLTLERYPGERGLILRCLGELTLSTADRLQREFDRLIPLGHPVLTVNLSGCTFVDVDGLMTLLDGCRRLRQNGSQLALVAGGGIPERLLHVLGLDWIMPVFPKEEVAQLALRGGGPPLHEVENWGDARKKSLEHWRVIEETLLQSPDEALRLLTSRFALCELSATQFHAAGEAAHAHCQFCPLFQALGGRRADLGCRSVLDPLLDAIRSGHLDAARKIIDRLIELIAAMPLPELVHSPASPGQASPI